jgi:C4-dicarboxylate-specific signal transduction histidine kinase
MLGYSDLLSVSPLPPEEQVLAARIAAQVRRTRTLVASLLTFVRQAPAQLGAVDLNSIVQTAMRLLAPQLDVQSVPIDMKLGAALPPVLADSNQLLHVCLHLAGLSSNRSHASEPTGLQVHTGQEKDTVFVEFSKVDASFQGDFQALQEVETGAKPSSLSLGACWRIVGEHGGRILVRPGMNGYAAFRVELPIGGKAAHLSLPAIAPSRAVAGSSS